MTRDMATRYRVSWDERPRSELEALVAEYEGRLVWYGEITDEYGTSTEAEVEVEDDWFRGAVHDLSESCTEI